MEQITTPEPGFYYHYKHDPAGPIDNYAYLVVGVGHHTEDDARPQDKLMVVYRPLYKTALVYTMGRLFDIRPRDMFLEPVMKDGIMMPRFARITDPSVIAQLQKIQEEMYAARS